MNNTTGYQLYQGHQGCVDWCNFLTSIDMSDLSPINIVDAGEDVVVMRMRLLPK